MTQRKKWFLSMKWPCLISQDLHFWDQKRTTECSKRKLLKMGISTKIGHFKYTLKNSFVWPNDLTYGDPYYSNICYNCRVGIANVETVVPTTKSKDRLILQKKRHTRAPVSIFISYFSMNRQKKNILLFLLILGTNPLFSC